MNVTRDLQVELPDGSMMPRLGMGTWYLGEGRRPQDAEIQALRAGLDAGVQLIDTAEMYGEGEAERLVGKAISGYSRKELYLVSKVYPYNAGRTHLRESLEASLDRLGTDYLDMYLLHWRGSVPLAETVACMQEAVNEGLIRRWGVSNFNLTDMQELLSLDGGSNCCVDQVLYHLGSRGIEVDLMPWLAERHIPVMAYCSLAQAGSLRRGLVSDRTVRQVAREHGFTPMQVLLAFVLHQPNIIAIPRSGSSEHTLENADVLGNPLADQEFDALSHALPAPNQPVPLDME
ncbi:aldo/keto reductase [Bifidobacterium sp.]|jgi:diketogulonate reductase-like aldo/keto reductase|uniref:aldo/keto reductase n=1 Tax=Bifidobacterium sp. TaxID=41200 RepID=UPI0025C12094|nr:aldo/keto reductase [Bifidobacterium sp.]MCH4208784.1 aldo/keto reductase [Bifidobacterium sp.]MCI1224742.1 aldo/keto reductase [Bifidobacterium sp.]